ncbi:DMT family transporter [Bacillus velezensis]|uniref:DMT family transporter n=1 Tax=Bacillus velezensis TaxID=492670 RepID=UPI002D76C0A5|nr:DMT family transporter [Bacillus velezensis]WRT01461.1 DMT family transporter [Bacillus velezensis]WRT09438.1 DMT family transporter [Bacillus velezensis]
MIKQLFWIFPLLSGAMFGSVGIFVRKLDVFGMDNYTILSSRVIVATILLFIGILVVDKSLLKIRMRDLWIFIAAGILGMLGLNFCYNESINQLTLSFSAVLLSLSPLFVLMLATFLFKEKITLLKIGSMLLAIFGCVLASGILDDTSHIKWSAVGIVVGLLSAFFYALYSIFSRIAMDRQYNVFTITFYSLLMSSVILLPLTSWSKIEEFIVVAPVENSMFIILHSICTSVLPYILFTVALRAIDTSKASILAAGGEPIAAMTFGVIFFSEVPTILSFGGIIITIVALTLFCKPNSKLPKPNVQ